MQLIVLPSNAAITYNHLWDGRSSRIKGKGTLFINNGLISAEQSDSSHAFFDFSRYTLLPALIDSHVHLMLPQTADPPTNRFQDYLKNGVCAVRDAGSKEACFYNDQNLIIRQAVAAIYKKGCYGSALGTGVKNVREAVMTVDRLADAGASQIKVITSGIFSFAQYSKTGPVSFTIEELKAIVKQARSHNLPVMAHASGDEAVKLSIHAEVSTIEHGYFMSRHTLKALAASGIFWVPTLAPVDAQLSRPDLSDKLTPSMRDVVHRSLLRHQELICEAAALGIKIAAGTDAGAPGVEHGSALSHEVSLLYKAGLPAKAALQAATSTAAHACGLPKIGSIEAGLQPYLLAVSGNPLKDPGILIKPAALFLPAK